MLKKDYKVIYIEIDEELTSLIDRIKKSSEKHLSIVIPRRASILQSVINLKLLKSQAEKHNKELSLVTTDKTGRNLASQVGLTVYQSLEKDLPNADFVEGYEPQGDNDNDDLIVDEPSEEDSQDSPKMSITSMLKDKKKSIRKNKFFDRISKEKENNQDDEHNIKSYTVVTPNKKILGVLFALSLGLLLVIGYYVLPNATIQVQPKIEKISYTTNITLVDADRYKNLLQDSKNLKIVGSYPIQITELTHTKEFQTTGERFTGTRASGKIRVINTVSQPWFFVKNTRFRTDDGIIFRSLDSVNVDRNAVVEIDVIADEMDESGKFVGDRGNLKKGVKLKIPGLREESQEKIYAEVVSDILNGVSSTVPYLLKEDVLAAKANIVDELFKIAESKLHDRIEEENKTNGTNLRLFSSRDYDSITKEIISVEGPDDLIGEDMSTFQVIAKIKVGGVAYDHNQIIDILSEGLAIKVLEDRSLKDIKKDDIEFHVVKREDAEKKIKVEATLAGITEYKVDSRLGDKIRGKVLDKSLEESQLIIKDMPEIGEVRIETWPFWVKRVPGVRSNIKVERLN